MSNKNITKELRVCKNPKCGKEYTAEIMDLMGARIVRGAGYCPRCAKELMPKDSEEEEESISTRIARQRRQMRLSCGIPAKFMNEDFSTFKDGRQPKAFKKCFDYAEKFPIAEPQGYPSLVLFSENSWGVGKTHLACAVGHRILDRWKGEKAGRSLVLFVSEPDIYTRIQATYGYPLDERTHRESEADIIQQLTSASLLIIDDVGKRRVHDLRFVQRTMFSIIDGRYRAMLPVVLTANLSQDRLKYYLGGGEDEAAFDRLTEMCGGRSGKGVKFFQLEGESYRREARL